MCMLLAAGCERDREPEVASPMAPESPLSESDQVDTERLEAEADLEAAEGNDIDGEIEFEETDTGVRIVASVNDATPGEHGIHVHERGDCSDIAGKSMGGHFAPDGEDHALPSESTSRHLGDLGNLVVDQDGNGKLEITVIGANLKPGDPKSLLGRALVVHSGRDSGRAEQPAGASGTPIACGVIEKS